MISLTHYKDDTHKEQLLARTHKDRFDHQPEITDEQISQILDIHDVIDPEIIIEKCSALLQLFMREEFPESHYTEMIPFIPLINPSSHDNTYLSKIITTLFSVVVTNSKICSLLIRNGILEQLWEFTPNISSFLLWQKLLNYNHEPEESFHGFDDHPDKDIFNIVFNFLKDNNFHIMINQIFTNIDPIAELSNFQIIGLSLQALGFYDKNDEGFLLCQPILEQLMQMFIETNNLDIMASFFSFTFSFVSKSSKAAHFMIDNSAFIQKFLSLPKDNVEFYNKACLYLSQILHCTGDFSDEMIHTICIFVTSLLESGVEVLLSSAGEIISEAICYKNVINFCIELGIIDTLFHLLDESVSFTTKSVSLGALCDLVRIATSENISIFFDHGFLNIVLNDFEQYYKSIGRKMVDALWSIVQIAGETENHELVELIFESDALVFIGNVYDEIRSSYDLAYLPYDSIEMSIVSLITSDPNFEAYHN